MGYQHAQNATLFKLYNKCSAELAQLHPFTFEVGLNKFHCKMLQIRSVRVFKAGNPYIAHLLLKKCSRLEGNDRVPKSHVPIMRAATGMSSLLDASVRAGLRVCTNATTPLRISAWASAWHFCHRASNTRKPCSVKRGWGSKMFQAGFPIPPQRAYRFLYFYTRFIFIHFFLALTPNLKLERAVSLNHFFSTIVSLMSP